jgi:hypothetical protein
MTSKTKCKGWEIIFRYNPGTCLGGLRKSIKILFRISGCAPGIENER